MFFIQVQKVTDAFVLFDFFMIHIVPQVHEHFKIRRPQRVEVLIVDVMQTFLKALQRLNRFLQNVRSSPLNVGRSFVSELGDDIYGYQLTGLCTSI